jgi:hypothetical protein
VGSARLRTRSAACVGAAALAAVGLPGCGSASHASSSPATTTSSAAIPPALVAQARPIGHGARFQPPAAGPVLGPCAPRLGQRYGAHVEVFATNRVVLIAAGIGTRPPRTFSAGRIAHAGCYGALVTLEPTGLVLVRPGARLTTADLFRSWGQPLTRRRLASFPAPPGTTVAVFVDGRRWPGPPGSVPLGRHAEIVLEVAPLVPPHHTYTFPLGL